MGCLATFFLLFLSLPQSFGIVSIGPLPLTGQFRVVGQQYMAYACLSISRTHEAGLATSSPRKVLLLQPENKMCAW